MAWDILGAPLLVGKGGGWYSSSARHHFTCDPSHYHHHHHHFSSTALTSRLCEQFRPIGECLKYAQKCAFAKCKIQLRSFLKKGRLLHFYDNETLTVQIECQAIRQRNGRHT